MIRARDTLTGTSVGTDDIIGVIPTPMTNDDGSEAAWRND